MCNGCVVFADTSQPTTTARRIGLWPSLLAVAGIVMAGVLSSVGRADPPSTCYVVANATVLDTKTTLTWQQTVDAGSYSWTDAQAYCATLALGGVPWRLPSMKELLTIVDFTRADPAIDAMVFPDTPSDYFWSSSPLAGSSSAAWGVNFNKGSAGAGPFDFTGRVRCVRP
jgi:hypothetical protein